MNRSTHEVPAGRVTVETTRAAAYRVPTDFAEADGTLEWDSTTLVVVSVGGGGSHAWGYSYADAAAARVVNELLAPLVAGRDAFAIDAAWQAMVRAVRNVGRHGIAACAISAVDSALWDLKARLLGLPLVALIGDLRPSVPVYASGGFTSYPVARLRQQMSRWSGEGHRMAKMKVGADPAEDLPRVAAAREALGPDARLFVDANGAYARKQALWFAERFAALGVGWFEEPVSSDDLAGLRLLRDRAPAAMDVAAGEYGYDPWYFRSMLEAGAVDVLQADATRCLGVTGFLRAATLAQAFQVPLSSHCAPSLHAHLCCAAPGVRHLEYFHDHVRIERLLFDGAPAAVAGAIAPDRGRPGLGLELKAADAERYAI
jgi:L-alanine-DL-glutamate epimerase-like enolase superfamily enzyme